MPVHRPVERIGSGDLVELATDVGPVPMHVGMVLLLDPPAGWDPEAARVVLTARLGGIPRLRQRLVRPPPGLGRPYWLTGRRSDPARHVSRLACPAPGDHEALLALAADAVCRPLDHAGPLWRGHLVGGLAGGRWAVVLVLHHVLTDGTGGLAMLAGLVDGAPAPAVLAPPAPPRRRDLLHDVVVARLAAVRHLPAAVAHALSGRTELGTGVGRAPRCSINAPTGPRRRLATVEVDLDHVRAAGRRHGATVNDVLVVVTTGALGRVLRARGERVGALVVSVPVSARASTTIDDLGNRTGVMPVRVDLSGTAEERLARVARTTSERKTRTRGASSALVGPAFRTLAALRLFRPMINRQRLVNTFLTNLRGPAEPMSLAGAPVVGMTPVTITAGNVGVAFAALSYAGTLGLTVIADPDVVPELPDLTAALEAELRGCGVPTR